MSGVAENPWTTIETTTQTIAVQTTSSVSPADSARESITIAA